MDSLFILLLAAPEAARALPIRAIVSLFGVYGISGSHPLNVLFEIPKSSDIRLYECPAFLNSVAAIFAAILVTLECYNSTNHSRESGCGKLESSWVRAYIQEMSPRSQSFLSHLAALVLIFGGFFFLVHRGPNGVATQPAASSASTSAQTAIVRAKLEAPPAAATSTKPAHAAVASAVKSSPKPITQKPVAKKEPAEEAVRIADPYPFPPQSFATVNDATRAALVNILCMPRTGGTLPPISGSGVIIDPRGVILTNAHVAQYVLLSKSPEINLSCVVRTGSPAVARWSAEILYIPPVWVGAHAVEIKAARPTGTGEHDYALLLITTSLDGAAFTPLSLGFPSLPFDTREAIGFQGDQVVVASYPAEFLGSQAAQFNLYSASSLTTIGQLLTFATRSVDLLSLGGVIEAQSGSSGGAVVNAWGRLIGLIATTSEGETTAARDLRAITLSYISRDLGLQTQFDLPTILAGDVAAQALDFNTRASPNLIALYMGYIAQ